MMRYYLIFDVRTRRVAARIATEHDEHWVKATIAAHFGSSEVYGHKVGALEIFPVYRVNETFKERYELMGDDG